MGTFTDVNNDVIPNATVVLNEVDSSYISYDRDKREKTDAELQRILRDVRKPLRMG
jgi:hypothetical protein